MGTEEVAAISKPFCDYFIAYRKSIHDGIPATNQDSSTIIPKNQKSMVFMNCSVSDIENVISSIRKYGSIDDISMKFYRPSLSYVAPYICEFFNQCIQHDVYPNNLKMAKVIPSHKKNACNNIANCRPISLHCNLENIFECMFYNRISHFLRNFSPLTT